MNRGRIGVVIDSFKRSAASSWYINWAKYLFVCLYHTDTPQRLPMLHTATWIMNIFAIFFILAAHEHYSIDVFVAFYLTSRLFLYYHSLANNRVLLQPDCVRMRIWFPMFSYFESSLDGIVPNEYESPLAAFKRYFRVLRSSSPRHSDGKKLS